MIGKYMFPKGLRAFFKLGEGASGGYGSFQQAHGVEDSRDDDFVAHRCVDHHVIEAAGGPVGAEIVLYKFDAVSVHVVDEFFGFFFVCGRRPQAPDFFRRGA